VKPIFTLVTHRRIAKFPDNQTKRTDNSYEDREHNRRSSRQGIRITRTKSTNRHQHPTAAYEVVAVFIWKSGRGGQLPQSDFISRVLGQTLRPTRLIQRSSKCRFRTARPTTSARSQKILETAVSRNSTFSRTPSHRFRISV